MASPSRSWFPSAPSVKSRLLTHSSHELPRWRTPSPMSASLIPPPVVQSTHAGPSQPPVTESLVVEKPSALEEKQRELEADLQFLLDAQAEGLIRGLEGGSLDERSSTGSTTPTIQSVRGFSKRRQRQTARRQPGLRSARKGIYNSILALSALKDDELQDVDTQMQQNEDTLEQIDEWEEKRRGLQEATGNVHSGEETVRVQRLKQEADVLQAEINQVELQLAEMKSRHRKLVRQAAAVENAVQAKMASYSSSLRMLEQDVERFLSLEPSDPNVTPISQDGKQSLWQLPPKRRNLEIAKAHFTEQRDLIAGERKRHEQEKSVLIEGATLWKDVVAEVTVFERRLRNEVASLGPSSPNSQSAWEDPPAATPSDGLKEILQHMDIVIDSLEKKVQTADEHRWTLLMAAIGAELDALKRGKEMLVGLAGTGDDESLETNGYDVNQKDSGEEIHALDKSFQTARCVSDAQDHDEPDPELLFSRLDTDTE
ncbi:Hypothetical predicted protein [Lecanosticta acicola]|uniref:Uncharacterized protein n=1 Tax=Lecanosticta acicola TaxID=111012 RepID=A0AAI8Z6N9_9PEZI|nr:Hypothetical predicted protein [Lecanosticta acicola]